MRRLGIAVLLLVGCESEERTRIRLDVPPSARGQITAVEVLLVNDGSDACGGLIRWGTGSCGAQCDPIERDDALPSEPAQRIELTPDETGSFGVPELDIEADGPLEVFVIARVEGTESIYGCRGISRGEQVDLPLWWPWCAARACDRFFHPNCRAEVECGAGALTDPLDIQCTSTEGTLSVWEQGGVECDVPVNRERCRPATISCNGERSTVLEDGVCPDTEGEEMCVADSATFMSAMDLDCNGAHPLCDVAECRDGVMCGEAACVGRVRCTPGGRAECVFEGEEVCNGLDDDCDDSMDEGVVDTDCNARRPENAPAADACTGNCTCGGGPACSEVGSACCEGACVDLANDPLYCGTCTIACNGDQRCVAGRCAERDVPDGGVGVDASMPECFDRDDCNLSHEGAADSCTGGECMCGGADACAFPEICCGDSPVCVDPLTDLRNCGRCGRVCLRCERGRCVD